MSQESTLNQIYRVTEDQLRGAVSGLCQNMTLERLRYLQCFHRALILYQAGVLDWKRARWT